MKKAGLLLFICLFEICYAYSQHSGVTIDINGSLASGWWIYTLGTGAGIDRTDNEPKLTLEAAVQYKPQRLGVGIGIGFSTLFDNSMEAFEDTRVQRRKYFIADKSVKFWQYYLQIEYDIFTNHKYSLSPQVRTGSFSIDTIHPEKDNFDNKYLISLGVVNSLALSERLGVTIMPFYQAMMISVKEPKQSGEKHRIFSLGLTAGLRYKI